MTVIYLFLWLVFYSFVGWAYESILCSVTEHKPVNRGFLNGPVCPVYGFGAILILLTFYGKTENGWILFFGGAALTCALEYFTSYLLEKIFHTRWWDYNHYRFHLNGRVCLLGAVVFGTFSLVLIKWVHPPVDAFTRSISRPMLIWISSAIFIILITDTVLTVHHILQLNGKLEKIQEAINDYIAETREQVKCFTGSLQDQTKTQLKSFTHNLQSKFEFSEYYTDKIQELLQNRHFMDKRIAKAFPTMKWNKNNEAWKKFVEGINLYKKNKK